MTKHRCTRIQCGGPVLLISLFPYVSVRHVPCMCHACAVHVPCVCVFSAPGLAGGHAGHDMWVGPEVKCREVKHALIMHTSFGSVRR